jgi:hypothetical protein
MVDGAIEPMYWSDAHRLSSRFYKESLKRLANLFILNRVVNEPSQAELGQARAWLISLIRRVDLAR